MPASAVWYFAKVGPTDTSFGQPFARHDYVVLHSEFSQQEGDFAALRLTVKNPRTALLAGPIWLWFSYSIDGAAAVPLFFGRLVGIPTDIFEEKVTLEFEARPADFNSQKAALAESLRVLPHYDLIFVDPAHRDDPDQVLAGRPAAWHIDPVTHEVTISDVLIGEDGVETFAASEILYRGIATDLSQIPLTSVSMEALFEWTQVASGTVDLTAHVRVNWPNEPDFDNPNVITSFTLNENDWPKPLANLGDNWTVAASTCAPVHNLTILSRTSGNRININWGSWGGGTTSAEVNESDQYIVTTPPGSIELTKIVTANDSQQTREPPDPVEGTGGEVTSSSHSVSWSNGIVPLHHLMPTLVAAYKAERQIKEVVRFTLEADVQPIVTLPGDDEALKITLNSISLNEEVDEQDDTDGEVLAPIRDARRRSYIVTERGLESLEHLIARARAELIRKSRAVKVTHHLTAASLLARLPDLSLRKSADVTDPRLPAGEALGKIIAFSVSLTGTGGVFDGSITIGCAIGNGGTVTAVPGSPTYVEDDYIGPAENWQEYEGGTVLFDSSVGYSPPLFAPNDDGIDFFSAEGPSVDDVMETALAVENGPAVQRTALLDGVPGIPGLQHGIAPWQTSTMPGEDAVSGRSEIIGKILEQVPTTARFKLKSMTRAFESEHVIAVTVLKISTGIDLGG